jgi:NADP-dependent 3-hydroxy acid dehydrogenase YdfG
MAPVVLVTGCSAGGIGHALCDEFAARGCKVIATSRNAATVENFKYKSHISKFALDVTDDEQVNSVVQQIVEREGRIDILVCNAGVLLAGPLIDQNIEDVKHTFDINVFGVWRMAKAVIPEMAKRHSGVIVNIGSVSGEVPTAWSGIYCASKAALHSLSEVMDMECRPLGIKVMLVSAGSVKSNISQNGVGRFNPSPDSLYKKYLPNIIARIYASQGTYSMPTEEFARDVVSKTLRKNPPSYTMTGGGSALFRILKWLPRSLVLTLAWMSLNRVVKKPVDGTS